MHHFALNRTLAYKIPIFTMQTKGSTRARYLTLLFACERHSKDALHWSSTLFNRWTMSPLFRLAGSSPSGIRTVLVQKSSDQPCPSISEALNGAATSSNVRENLFASLWTRLDPWHLGDDLNSNKPVIQVKMGRSHLFKNWMNISIIMFWNQTIFFTSSFWNIIKRIN